MVEACANTSTNSIISRIRPGCASEHAGRFLFEGENMDTQYWQFSYGPIDITAQHLFDRIIKTIEGWCAVYKAFDMILIDNPLQIEDDNIRFRIYRQKGGQTDESHYAEVMGDPLVTLHDGTTIRYMVNSQYFSHLKGQFDAELFEFMKEGLEPELTLLAGETTRTSQGMGYDELGDSSSDPSHLPGLLSNHNGSDSIIPQREPYRTYWFKSWTEITKLDKYYEHLRETNDPDIYEEKITAESYKQVLAPIWGGRAPCDKTIREIRKAGRAGRLRRKLR